MYFLEYSLQHARVIPYINSELSDDKFEEKNDNKQLN